MRIILNRHINEIAVYCEDSATEIGLLSQEEAVELATKLLDLAGRMKDNGDDE